MIPEIVRENPLKSLATFIGSLSVILAAAQSIDSRYAHAGEVLKYQNQMQSQLLEYRYQDLDNRVFELELRKGNSPDTWTPTDEAVLVRYRRQLDNAGREAVRQQIPRFDRYLPEKYQQPKVGQN